MRHLGSVMSYFLEIVKEKGTNLYDSLSKSTFLLLPHACKKPDTVTMF
jgi:hypothetical protein